MAGAQKTVGALDLLTLKPFKGHIHTFWKKRQKSLL